MPHLPRKPKTADLLIIDIILQCDSCKTLMPIVHRVLPTVTTQLDIHHLSLLKCACGDSMHWLIVKPSEEISTSYG